ncbi:MAG: hypothetical protein AAB840_01800 [Patescibacteria group bacterium]
MTLTIPNSKPLIELFKELSGVMANFEKPEVLEAIGLEVAQESIP